MNPILAAILSRAGAHGAPPGAGAPPAPAGGLPPEMASAIQSGSPQSLQGEDSPDHEQNEVQLLTKILGDMQTFLRVAADEDDKAVIAACIAQIQKLRAKDQAESDGALQGKTSPRLMRKASAVQGGAGGGY